MKKALVSIAVLAIFLANMVFAEELPSPGILPDHPLYPVKTFFEKVRLWLTFDPVARARFHAFLAEQRLAELNATLSQGKYQHALRLREEYERELSESENEREKAFGLGRNATVLLEHVCNMTYKHITVLQRVLSRAPEAARPGLERAINASIRGHERCLEKVEEILNKTNENLKKRSCMSDYDCLNIDVWCPLKLGRELRCFIPENKTTGICICLPKWNRTRINCTDDSECKGLICPGVLGNDTPVCLNEKCVCGARWEIRNRTELRERFGEEVREEIIERIKERVAEIRGRRG